MKWLLQFFWIMPPKRPQPRENLVHLRTGLIVPRDPKDASEFNERALNEFLKAIDVLEQYFEWSSRYTARAYNLVIVLVILALIEFGPKYLGRFGHAISEVVVSDTSAATTATDPSPPDGAPTATATNQP